MFTPARIFTALQVTLQGGIIASVASEGAPKWVIISLTGLSVFLGILVSTTGPIQASSPTVPPVKS